MGLFLCRSLLGKCLLDDSNKFVKVSYYHIYHLFIFSLLFLYKKVIKKFGENENCLKELLEIKVTQVPIELFEHLIKGYKSKEIK